MLNKVIIIGNITRDIELRYTPSGKAVATIGLACNRSYKSGDEFKEEVCFINCVIWGKRAENCASQLKKGDPLFIEGRLQSRSWEDKNKNKRTTIEVVAEDIQFINRTKKGTTPEESQQPEEAVNDDWGNESADEI